MKKQLLAASLTAVGVLLSLYTASVSASEYPQVKRFTLETFDPFTTCFPDASATVTFIASEEKRGVDSLKIKVAGLKANTPFALFLTELAEPPFGQAQYIADFTTDKSGAGSVSTSTIIEEAFSLVPDASGAVSRKELNHVVFWFANPEDDDECFTDGSTGFVTPFDGDGEAGLAAMSSKNALPEAPLP
ncbi:hypothetical protein [Gloeobacter violaceus]|uniref:Gll3958 protein n=1 Tax=Gloeobacter violaceus (strain ATCC 29082 / PCC 7421) TaxID=251221 RepID=Q7NEC2_GLOVI|nr:hypothetical protein [Gloeobacter violaceus]BAC91899.1 gll3958 [Gloeobacter violaceus PCC 7421]